MATNVSEEAFYTILKWGLPAAGGVRVRGDKCIYQIYTTTNPQMGSDLSATMTASIKIADFQNFYNNAYNILIFQPAKPITSSDDPNTPLNVTSVRFIKNANDAGGRISFRDGNNNEVTGYGVSLAGNSHERPLSIKVAGSWVAAADVYVGVVCKTDQAESYYTAGFGLGGYITPSAKADYPGLSPWTTSWTSGTAFGATPGLLEEWLDGNYWNPVGNAGRPDSDPGEGTGGQGNYSRPDFDVPFPSLPSLGAAESGFTRLYVVDQSELNDLASELWTPTFYNAIVKNRQSPFDNIISLGIIPYTGMTGSTEPIQIGNYECTQAVGDRLATSFYNIDCGNISVQEFYNDWLDYDGFTQMQVFLPFCGFVEVSPSEFMEGVMNVQYNFDVFSGACIAGIISIKDGKTKCLYIKEGNIRSDIPINGADYSRYYQTQIGAAIQITSGIMTANPAAAAGGLNNLLWAKPGYQRSGQVSTTHGLLSIRYPFIVFHTPDAVQSNYFGDLHGYMSNKSCLIGDCTGFLRTNVSFNELAGIPCTDEERQMIKDSLSRGIYI